MSLSRFFTVLGLAASVACAATPSDTDDAAGGDEAIRAGEAPQLCAAIRGNGEYIVTHFASLSRIVETYGIPYGTAGGSSGSITQFVYESILMSPVIRTCGDHKCSDAEASARVALALKSVEGYGESLLASDEGQAVINLSKLAPALKKAVADRGVQALLDSGTQADAEAAVVQLKEVLSLPEVRDLINPEIPQLLADPARATWAAKDVQQSIVTLGAFSVDDNRLFFRPGLLNWNDLATLFGRVGSFYAGYAPTDTAAQSKWLDDCAAPSVGKHWTEVDASCSDRFHTMISDYRAAVRANPNAKSRIDDRVDDGNSPLAHLISTSVLDASAAAAYTQARTEYLNGKYPTGNIAFTPAFEDVKFGYWGKAADLAKVKQNLQNYSDEKTEKFLALGGGTWRSVLSASPAEPGLSRFTEVGGGRYSAGGWSDLAPVLVLKNLGCKQVVYVTREQDESGFATKIAKRLGMNEESWKNLYDLSSESSFTKSLEEADGVWCTNWNSFTDLQQHEMSKDSYSAPLEAHSLSRRPLRAYPNMTPKTGKAGCTPLVSGGAKFPVD